MCDSSTILPLASECRKATPRFNATVAHRGGGFCCFMTKTVAGNTYRDLTAIRLHHIDKNRHPYWEFKCSCGKQFIAESHQTIRRGHCGCRTVKRWDIRLPLVERFLKWVDVRGKDECWEWQGYRNKLGYGIFLRDKAYRASYRIFNGPIINGLWVLHKCDNPPCCNPNHLYLGTPQDNVDDCWNRGRAKRERGTDRYCCKLDETKVREIMRRILAGESVLALSREFRIGRSVIYHIAYGDRWRHVEYPGFEKNHLRVAYEQARLRL